MIDGVDSYDMRNIKSPLKRLPSIIRHPSFLGDALPPFGKGKQKGPDGGGESTTADRVGEDPKVRKDSVMTGIGGSMSGSSSVSVSSVSSCKRPAVTVKKRVLGVDEKGESSRSEQEALGPISDDRFKEKGKGKGKDSVGDDLREACSPRPVPREPNVVAPKTALQLAPKPSTVAPRRSRFVEDLEDVWTEAAGWTPAEVCQRICLPGPTRPAAKDDLIKLYFPPVVAQKKKPQAILDDSAPASVTPSSGWCHHDGGCLQKKGRRRRNLTRAVMRLAKKPTRWNKEDKGKKRAACEICGDDTRLDLRDWKRREDAQEPEGDASVAAELTAMLSRLYDRDEAESSWRCSVCGQEAGEDLTWERDEDAREEKNGETTLGSKDIETDSSLEAAVSLTEIPEAWWTRRFRL
ncbi:uncharacterized protein ColSpa_02159 [Colletotrichum spaethianum]|uniref:Uncharacterized protein n=1 Tax=Colletotrichum spaethianum TaxID=700344 RepID=A0AA37NZB8_9PEZI|nr:uncharacterized protein ColSpa_02159 [Colletotrichum spaethianum]GKT41978.1 hypothetical protein ColSpa_02159 [Colletotrichum spaethianum]